MGWSGYGLEDSDGATSVAMDFLQKAGVISKSADTLTTRQGVDGIYELSVSEYDLDDKGLLKLYRNWDKAMHKILPKQVFVDGLDAACESKEHKRYHEELILIPIQMMAQVFLASQARIPGPLLNLALDATHMLVDFQHTKAFASPTKRRRVLREFIDQLENSEDSEVRYYNKAQDRISYRRGHAPDPGPAPSRKRRAP